MVNGASFNYISAPVNNLAVASLTLQVADTTHTEEVSKLSKFQKDMYGSGMIFSEAYIATRLSKTGLKMGRQYIKTPLVYGSSSRMIKQSFQGFTIASKDVENTTILAMHLNKYQSRTDESGKVGKFSKNFDYIGLLNAKAILNDGANSIFIKNKSIKNLDIIYQHLDAKDFAKTNFMQVKYDFKTMANIKLTAQQYRTSWNNSAVTSLTKKDAKINGFKIESTINNINFFAAKSKNSSDGDVFGGLGLAADAITTAGYVNGGNYLHSSSSKKYGINTEVKGIKLSIWKAIHKNENNNIYDTLYGADYSETDYMIDYDITEKLHLRLLYVKYDGTLKRVFNEPNYDYQSRVKLTYSF